MKHKLNPQAVARAQMNQLIKASEDVSFECCTGCGNDTFHQASKLKKVPGFVVGASEPQLVFFDVMSCTECGKLYNKEEEQPHEQKTI